MSGEKRGKWLEEGRYEKGRENEYDGELEKEGEGFLKEVEVDWEE
ncbi:replication protein [Staphylococcus epidermidis]|nr:replication protein [Staphylococcus epidermidis]